MFLKHMRWRALFLSFFFFEMKEKCKVSCVKLVVWSIVAQKGTNILIFYIFEYDAEYGAECSAESVAKQVIYFIRIRSNLRRNIRNETWQRSYRKFKNYQRQICVPFLRLNLRIFALQKHKACKDRITYCVGLSLHIKRKLPPDVFYKKLLF